MERSWFTALRIQNEGKVDWSEEQRLMYLRLRRMIASNNEHVLEQMHSEQENRLHFLQLSPAPSIYSGYGECGELYFYYGNMNLSAFQKSFQSKKKDEIQDGNSDLEFCIEIECPIDLAPIKYLEQHEKPDPETRYNIMRKSLSENVSESTFKLYIHISCPTSLKNRLPCMFTWEISSRDFDK